MASGRLKRVIGGRRSPRANSVTEEDDEDQQQHTAEQLAPSPRRTEESTSVSPRRSNAGEDLEETPKV
jgi:hypothetical protein